MENLVDPSNPRYYSTDKVNVRMINLDVALSTLVLKRDQRDSTTQLSRDALLDAFLDKLSPHYQLKLPSHAEPVVRYYFLLMLSGLW
jgi:hypothetical protein